MVMAGTLQQHRKRPDVVCAEDHINPRSLLHDGGAVLLGKASTHGNLHALIAFLGRCQLTELAVQLVVRVLAHGAGVEHHEIGVSIDGGHVARRFEQTGDALRVMRVHLTAQSAHLVSGGGHIGGIGGGSHQGVGQLSHPTMLRTRSN